MIELNSDSSLLAAIAKGDETSFRTFYLRYNKSVYNLAFNFAKNIEDAEEITQDVFMKVCRNAGSFKGQSGVKTWIYRVTVNTALTAVKRKKNRFLSLLNESEPVDFHHPGVALEQEEDAKQLFASISDLPENQKAAFILSYIEELPRQEVADILDLSLKAIEALLQRAKKNLRKNLGKSHPERGKSKK